MLIKNSSQTSPGIYQVTVMHEEVYKTFELKPGFTSISQHHLQKLAYRQMHLFLKERNEAMQAEIAKARAAREKAEETEEKVEETESTLPSGKYKGQLYTSADIPTEYFKRAKRFAKGENKTRMEEEIIRRATL